MELSYEQYSELMDELVAEGYDVLEASEMIFNGQLDEAPNLGTGGTAADLQRQRAQASPKPAAKPLPTGNFQQTRSTGRASSETRNLYRSSSDNKVYRNYNDALAARNSRMNSLRGAQDMLKGRTPAPLGQTPAERARPLPGTPGAATPRPAAAARPAAAPAARPATAPASTPAARPTAAPAPAGRTSAPAPTASAKVDTAPAAKPAGTPMQQWAAANPKLAAAAAERARTRGTSSTTNPLMKDMKSNLPAPSSPSPTTASTGFSLAKKGVDLSKTNKQKINAGMEIQGDRLQEELRGDNYGGNARPDSLLDAYQSIYNS